MKTAIVEGSVTGGSRADPKQTCVALPTLRLIGLLFCRRFLSENRDTLFRNLL